MRAGWNGLKGSPSRASSSAAAAAPLCVRVRERETGRQFLFSVSHFHRTDEVKRREQAIGFREYAAAQTLPMIAVGDFNFDVDIPFGRGNEAFRLFTEGGAAVGQTANARCHQLVGRKA